MATPSPQGFSRYSPGNDRRKTFHVVRLEKRRAHARSMRPQDSEQPDGSMTEAQRVASMTPSNDPSAQSTKCAICTASNPPSSNFCNECGSPLSLCVCPQCEAIHARTAKNCIACGFVTPDEDTAAAPDAAPAAAAPVPSPARLDDGGDPAEPTEKDWKALLQEIQEQVHQVEAQVHWQQDIPAPVVEQDHQRSASRLVSWPAIVAALRRHLHEGAQRFPWRLASWSAIVAGLRRHLHIPARPAGRDAKQFPSKLASWSTLVPALRRKARIPGSLVEQDAKWSLLRWASMSAVVAGTAVLVYLLLARPLLPLDHSSKNGVLPTGEAATDFQPYAEGTIIRETPVPQLAVPSVAEPPAGEVERVSAAPPESFSARTTASRSPTAEAVRAQMKQRPSLLAERSAPKAAVSARGVQAVPPKTAPARVAILKPMPVKNGRGAGTSASGSRAAEAPLLKPEPARAPASPPCSAASDTSAPCGAKTAVAAESKTNAPQTTTASPAPLQPESAAKIPPGSADLAGSAPAAAHDSPPAAQPVPAAAPEATASATNNAPAQPAPTVAAMTASTGADAAPKPSTAGSVAKIVHRVDPAFPREAITEGITSGNVKVRLSIAGNGTVSSVTITESQPRRVFDQAVIRALKRWQFESTGAPQTIETEVTFSAEN